jgi:acetyl esterase/lipase
VSDSHDVLVRPATPPDLTLRYGEGNDHVVDVRLPSSEQPAGPRPLVVVVHGGFWMAEYDRTHAGPQSVGLAEAGYVVATVEYRRIGGGGGWTGTFDDVAALTDVVPLLVSDALPGRVDPSNAVLVGHSAGGHLAAWAAARHRLPPESQWHREKALDVAVVSLAGVLDLEEAERLGLGGGAVRLLLDGGPGERPERFAETDPAALTPRGGRMVLVHGTRDRQVPVEISRRYVDRAHRLGDDVVLHELDGLGHYELIDPRSAAWPAVLAAVEEARA